MNLIKKEVVLIFLLILLNIVLRIPWTPHEIGWDSFIVHSLANSISTFGEARWWIHVTSILGSYPLSEPSALPFLLSGVVQVVGVDTEMAILIYNLLFAIFIVFFSYLMAGVIWDNRIFKFLVAFVFSTSQGIVTFSTWTANARTLFVFVFPVFIYVLLKTRVNNRFRFGFLTFIIVILLAATHHYIYFIIPIGASYFGVGLFYFLNEKVLEAKSIKVPEIFISGALIMIFLVMFIVPFFTGTFSDTDPGGGGSRYGWMVEMIKNYIRYIGVPVVFVVSGYFYLLFKKEKRFGEIFLLLAVASIAPLLYNATYTKWFVISFASLLIGVGFTTLSTSNTRRIKRYKSHFIAIFLVLSILFTGYYQFLHFLNGSPQRSRYMEDRTYQGGRWVDEFSDRRIASEPYIHQRIQAASQTPTLSTSSPLDLIYGFIDADKLKVEQIFNFKELGFYVQDPYRVVEGPKVDWAADNIVTVQYARRLISRYQIGYYLENMDRPMAIDGLVEKSDDMVYDNGKIRIWRL